jgi:hypothetical protein
MGRADWHIEETIHNRAERDGEFAIAWAILRVLDAISAMEESLHDIAQALKKPDDDEVSRD